MKDSRRRRRRRRTCGTTCEQADHVHTHLPFPCSSDPVFSHPHLHPPYPQIIAGFPYSDTKATFTRIHPRFWTSCDGRGDTRVITPFRTPDVQSHTVSTHKSRNQEFAFFPGLQSGVASAWVRRERIVSTSSSPSRPCS